MRHVPVHFLVRGGAVEDLEAEGTAFISLQLADCAGLHLFLSSVII